MSDSSTLRLIQGFHADELSSRRMSIDSVTSSVLSGKSNKRYSQALNDVLAVMGEIDDDSDDESSPAANAVAAAIENTYTPGSLNRASPNTTDRVLGVLFGQSPPLTSPLSQSELDISERTSATPDENKVLQRLMMELTNAPPTVQHELSSGGFQSNNPILLAADRMFQQNRYSLDPVWNALSETSGQTSVRRRSSTETTLERADFNLLPPPLGKKPLTPLGEKDKSKASTPPEPVPTRTLVQRKKTKAVPKEVVEEPPNEPEEELPVVQSKGGEIRTKPRRPSKTKQSRKKALKAPTPPDDEEVSLIEPPTAHEVTGIIASPIAIPPEPTPQDPLPEAPTPLAEIEPQPVIESVRPQNKASESKKSSAVPKQQAKKGPSRRRNSLASDKSKPSTKRATISPGDSGSSEKPPRKSSLGNKLSDYPTGKPKLKPRVRASLEKKTEDLEEDADENAEDEQNHLRDLRRVVAKSAKTSTVSPNWVTPRPAGESQFASGKMPSANGGETVVDDASLAIELSGGESQEQLALLSDEPINVDEPDSPGPISYEEPASPRSPLPPLPPPEMEKTESRRKVSKPKLRSRSVVSSSVALVPTESQLAVRSVRPHSARPPTSRSLGLESMAPGKLRRISICDSDTEVADESKIVRSKSKRLRVPPLRWWAGERIEYRSADGTLANAIATAVYKKEDPELVNPQPSTRKRSQLALPAPRRASPATALATRRGGPRQSKQQNLQKCRIKLQLDIESDESFWTTADEKPRSVPSTGLNDKNRQMIIRRTDEKSVWQVFKRDDLCFSVMVVHQTERHTSVLIRLPPSETNGVDTSKQSELVVELIAGESTLVLINSIGAGGKLGANKGTRLDTPGDTVIIPSSHQYQFKNLSETNEALLLTHVVPFTDLIYS